MTAQLKDRIAGIIDAEQGESIGGATFVPLISLDSGRRCGLTAELSWAVASEPGAAQETLEMFEQGHERSLFELLEWERSDLEGQLEEIAKEHEIPVEPLLLAVPAEKLVRAALATGSSFYARLALRWLLPTELRLLRQEIKEAASNKELPVAVRELAAHLVVPER